MLLCHKKLQYPLKPNLHRHRTMKYSTFAFLTTFAFSMGISESFTTPGAAAQARPIDTSLSMSKNNDPKVGGNNFAASAVAAAYLLANVLSSDAAFAMDSFVGYGPSSNHDVTESSSLIIAARSGGRAGGRAAPRMMSRPSSSSSSSSTTRIINQRTTVIAPPPVVIGGGYGGYGYGGYYDPTPGIGKCRCFCCRPSPSEFRTCFA